MEQIAEIPNADCTLCSHNLDHFALRISSHPRIPVPVCLLCLEDVTKKFEDVEEDDSNDQCSWCGDFDKGELFICGDGTSCKHYFCPNCIETNLGSAFLSNLRASDENWSCFVCDTQQVSDLTTALTECIARSMYTLRLKEPSCAEGNELNYSGEADVEEDVVRLKVLMEESTAANRYLEIEATERKEQEIREEVSTPGSTEDSR